jgi:hypothetical protein
MKNTAAIQIRINVRGGSDEVCARTALALARGDGYPNAEVLRITRTAKGAVVTVAA